MTIMSSMAEATTSAATGMPRFEDGSINLQEVLRQLAEPVVNEVMSAEADQLCGATGNSRNGYRERMFTTCVGTLTLRVPKLRTGSFFPEDVLERHQRVDRAVVAAVAEMHATGTSTRKVQRVASAMGIERISGKQVGAICASPDSEAEELSTRPLGDLPTPYLWLDATHARRRRSGRVTSTAAVTAIGCDSGGWRHVLSVGAVDTESYDSWSASLGRVRERGARREARHLRRPRGPQARGRGDLPGGRLAEMRRAPHARPREGRAGSRRTLRRVSRIMALVFRLREPAPRAAYHLAIEMLEGFCLEAAHILEEAEPNALAYLDFPPSHWKRLRTNNLQEHTNREIKRRLRVVQVFPPVASLERLTGSVVFD